MQREGEREGEGEGKRRGEKGEKREEEFEGPCWRESEKEVFSCGFSGRRERGNGGERRDKCWKRNNNLLLQRKYITRGNSERGR